MKRSLKGKLIISYLAVALLTVLVVSILIRLTSNQSLMNLVVEQQTARLSDAVQTYYESNGNLTNFFEYYLTVNRPEPNPDQPEGPDTPPEKREIRGVLGLVDTDYRALIPTFGIEIGDLVPQERIQKEISVKVDGETIAYILPDTGFEFKLSAEEELFLQRTTLAISLAAVAGVVAAVIMGYILAGGLIKPIRRLTRASQALARGDLNQQVPVSSQDELGLLTETFNQMSSGLARADEERKRLTADISHDLSTPLQIISGYVEMLEAGEVSLTPQRVEIIKTEIGHLRRMVSDLGTLTQVEAGGLDFQKVRIQPAELLERVYQAYYPIASHQSVSLKLDLPETCPEILVDEGRMQQVLKNLIENALRYTPSGGEILLSVSANGRVLLKVQDSGTGIDPQDLQYVFDRFYRADKSRGGNSGKMGLGLAICKALVTAQGGTIWAESAGIGQGTCMVIAFEPANL